MENQIVVYKYDDQEIEFDLGKNVMVNATEMAKPFGAKVNEFMSNAQTKSFINACLKSGNSRFISVQSKDDLYYSQKKSGTWMHRILALKFAAWLDPDFELWVYHTIDQIVFATARQIEETNQERARIKTKMDTLRLELLSNDQFRQYELLQVQDRQYAYSQSKVNRNQLNMFIEKEKEGK